MNEIALKFKTFETYYVYESDEPKMRVLLLPELPCVSCGNKGMMFVTGTCILCGEGFSAMFCASAYSDADASGSVDGFSVNTEVPICNECRAFREALLHARRALETPPGFN